MYWPELYIWLVHFKQWIMLLLIFFLDNSDCFVDNVAYCCGNEIDNVATETIELCQIECQNNPRCSHWTYIAEHCKPCFLKSAKGVKFHHATILHLAQWTEYLLLSHSFIFTCITCMIITHPHFYRFLFS